MSDNKLFLTIKEAQKIELNILLAFNSFCKERGIKYSLAGGSLLGAIRHQGFIPWDDDVDVCLTRPDYDMLIEQKNSLNKITGYSLEGYLGVDLDEAPFLKLVDYDVNSQSRYEYFKSHIGIDIFPVEALSGNFDELEQNYNLANKYRSYINIANALPVGTEAKWKKIVLSVFPDQLRKILISRYSAKLNKLNHLYPYGSTANVGVLAWGQYGMGEKMNIDEFEKKIQVEFEGYKLPAMSCWESYLEGLYGDYLKLPPEEDRMGHQPSIWIE